MNAFAVDSDSAARAPLLQRPADETATMRLLTRRLVREYADRYPAVYVERVVTAALERFGSGRVRIYVPVLVERTAREILDSAGDVEVSKQMC